MNLLPCKIYSPDKLKSYIFGYQYYKANAETPFINLKLPYGDVQLIFQFKGEIAHYNALTSDWQLRPHAFFAGSNEYAFPIKLPPGAEIFCVLFNIGVARNLLQINTLKIKNRLTHPEDLWGREGKLLTEQIRFCRSNGQRIRIVENFLQGKIHPPKKSKITASINYLHRVRGICNIDEMRAVSGLSNSHFRRKFKEDVGLNPKSFQKILRIISLIKFFFQHPEISLTKLGYQFGYCDQSHFIKDFKSVIGSTPRQFFPKA